MNVGSLFTGIGGFDLGLERAGMRVVWQCEADDFCRRVLAKHWPDVPCFEDVRGLSRAAGTPPVDVLCGGFPCQDISYAGAGAGIAGERSGLWSEYARLVGELRPRYVVVENVSALLARGLGVVLGDLAALGYDAEWDCIPASAVGAPHRRDRIWIVAYPNGGGFQVGGESDSGSEQTRRAASQRRDTDRLREAVADPHQERRRGRSGQFGTCGRTESADGGAAVADAEREGSQGHGGRALRPRAVAGGGEVGDTDRAPEDAHASPGGSRRAVSEPGWWSVEPDVGRVAHGVPARVDRLRSLGNALVPQIAEWIGRRIMRYEEMR